MRVNDRIQWLHKKISDNAYPSAIDLAEKFSISRRQAQRDVDYMKTELKAPIKYSYSRSGYYYAEDFSLPFMHETENDADLHDVIVSLSERGKIKADGSLIQLQLPYTATLYVPDRKAVLELRSLITEDLPKNKYRCEFQSIELFLGIIIASGASIKILEPSWLREKLISLAKHAIETNDSDVAEECL